MGAQCHPHPCVPHHVTCWSPPWYTLFPSLPMPRPGVRGRGQVPHARAAAPGTGLFLSTVGPGVLQNPSSRWDGQGQWGLGGQDHPATVCPPFPFSSSCAQPPHATHVSQDAAGAATRSRAECGGPVSRHCRPLRPASPWASGCGGLQDPPPCCPAATPAQPHGALSGGDPGQGQHQCGSARLAGQLLLGEPRE